MTAAPVLHQPHLATQNHAERLLSALHRDDVARHLLGEQAAPTPRQVASTLRALADFPLCLRILPQSTRRHRAGDKVSGLALYLEGFADHLAHHEVRTPYDPRYWILGEPVTLRLLRLVSAGTALDGARPTAEQSAATLLALSDTQALELPRRMVEVAGDGDLPWNGATGIGQFFRELADLDG
ncbi:hypothetical protein [Georgenia sp. Marseille-Q6866]